MMSGYWAITAQIITHDGSFSGSRQIPLFYLHTNVQGIVSHDHAVRIAKRIINPLGIIADEDIKVCAANIPVPAAATD